MSQFINSSKKNSQSPIKNDFKENLNMFEEERQTLKFNQTDFSNKKSLNQQEYFQKTTSSLENSYQMKQNQTIHSTSNQFLDEFEALFFDERKNHAKSKDTLKHELNQTQIQNFTLNEEILKLTEIQNEINNHQQILQKMLSNAKFNYQTTKQKMSLETHVLNCETIFFNNSFKIEAEKYKMLKSSFEDETRKEVQNIRKEKEETTFELKREIDILKREKAELEIEFKNVKQNFDFNIKPSYDFAIKLQNERQFEIIKFELLISEIKRIITFKKNQIERLSVSISENNNYFSQKELFYFDCINQMQNHLESAVLKLNLSQEYLLKENRNLESIINDHRVLELHLKTLVLENESKNNDIEKAKIDNILDIEEINLKNENQIQDQEMDEIEIDRQILEYENKLVEVRNQQMELNRHRKNICGDLRSKINLEIQNVLQVD